MFVDNTVKLSLKKKYDKRPECFEDVSANIK